MSMSGGRRSPFFSPLLPSPSETPCITAITLILHILSKNPLTQSFLYLIQRQNLIDKKNINQDFELNDLRSKKRPMMIVWSLFFEREHLQIVELLWTKISIDRDPVAEELFVELDRLKWNWLTHKSNWGHSTWNI